MIYAAIRVLVEDYGGDAISWAITGFLLVSAIGRAVRSPGT